MQSALDTLMDTKSYDRKLWIDSLYPGSKVAMAEFYEEETELGLDYRIFTVTTISPKRRTFVLNDGRICDNLGIVSGCRYIEPVTKENEVKAKKTVLVSKIIKLVESSCITIDLLQQVESILGNKRQPK